MPNRIIREGIITSDRVDQLDAAAEVFYRRLLNKVDDHGLYDGRSSILRANLYPLRLDRVREADISRWMAACQKAGLIVLYEAGGKPFLKVLNTNWQVRSEPKYPSPSADNSCAQLLSTEHLDVDVVVVEDVGKTFSLEPRTRARSKPVLRRWNGETVEKLPVVGHTEPEIAITQEFVDEMQRAYPAVDVAATLPEMRAWCLANPQKRKTPTGVYQFVQRWLAKEQDRG